jgi:hypothetical protein
VESTKEWSASGDAVEPSSAAASVSASTKGLARGVTVAGWEQRVTSRRRIGSLTGRTATAVVVVDQEAGDPADAESAGDQAPGREWIARGRNRSAAQSRYRGRPESEEHLVGAPALRTAARKLTGPEQQEVALLDLNPACVTAASRSAGEIA